MTADDRLHLSLEEGDAGQTPRSIASKDRPARAIDAAGERTSRMPDQKSIHGNFSIPTLPGWVNLTEAGVLLGVTRQHAWKMADSGRFASLHRVGSQPVYVVSTDEIARMNEAKAARAAIKAAKVTA